MFTNAYVAAPSCSPSRAAMLTGQWHWRLEEGANLLGPRCRRSCWKTVRDVPGVRIAVWPGEELWQQPGPVGPPDWRLANRQYRYLRRWPAHRCGSIGDSMNLGSSSPNYPNATSVGPFLANPTQNKFWNIAAFDASSSSLSLRSGNAGRNTLLTPGRQNWDASVARNFRILEGHSLQFRFEAFNLTTRTGTRHRPMHRHPPPSA